MTHQVVSAPPIGTSALSGDRATRERQWSGRKRATFAAGGADGSDDLAFAAGRAAVGEGRRIDERDAGVEGGLWVSTAPMPPA
jgi:hypothetical protein